MPFQKSLVILNCFPPLMAACIVQLMLISQWHFCHLMGCQLCEQHSTSSPELWQLQLRCASLPSQGLLSKAIGFQCSAIILGWKQLPGTWAAPPPSAETTGWRLHRWDPGYEKRSLEKDKGTICLWKIMVYPFHCILSQNLREENHLPSNFPRTHCTKPKEANLKCCSYKEAPDSQTGTRQLSLRWQ